jgi:hypothetical protein
VSSLRKCQGSTSPTTLQINGPISRTGQADPANPVAVSTFCVAATSSASVNQAAGLPGPGALRLPSRVCYGTPCSF